MHQYGALAEWATTVHQYGALAEWRLNTLRVRGIGGVLKVIPRNSLNYLPNPFHHVKTLSNTPKRLSIQFADEMRG